MILPHDVTVTEGENNLEPLINPLELQSFLMFNWILMFLFIYVH